MTLAGRTPPRPWTWTRRAAWALAIVAALATGCARTFYRRQADADAYNLVYDASSHPHWDQSDFTIAIDPASRMHDPNCPDHEPMPPDDPAAHKFMHKVDNRKGNAWWHIHGDTPFVENPEWLNGMPLDEQGALVLSADEAVRQGFLHSRDYQRELEEVYLTALDVAFERFRFDSQFFAGFQTTYAAAAKDRPGSGSAAAALADLSAPHRSRSFLGVGTNPYNQGGIRMNKSFTTGANLAVNLANSMVWQLAGPNDTYRGATLLDFNLVQPLLRNAGRDRVMERLTVSERTLLYNLRALERYRQGHYVRILTGRDPGNGPQRRGGVAGQGLEGFQGIGGGFGNIVTGSGGQQGAVAGAGGGGAGAGAGTASGYLGLLQNVQEIRNQEDNIQRLRDNAARLETRLTELLTTRAAADVVLRQRLQVAQARQAVLNAQSRLLNARNTFEQNVDQFKITLGLPPTLCVRIEDDLTSEYQLIDRSLNRSQTAIQDAIEAIAEGNQAILEMIVEDEHPETNLPRRRLPMSPELGEKLTRLRTATEPISRLHRRLKSESLPMIDDDLAKLEQAIPRRVQSLKLLAERHQRERKSICELLPSQGLDATVFDTSRLESLPKKARAEFARLTKLIDEYPQRVERIRSALDQALAGRSSNTEEVETPRGRKTDEDAPELLDPAMDEMEEDGAATQEIDETGEPTDPNNEKEDAAFGDDETATHRSGSVNRLRMVAWKQPAKPSAKQPAPKLEPAKDAGDQVADQDGEVESLDDDERRFLDIRDSVLLTSQNLLNDLRNDVLALQLLQARARTEAVELNKVDLRAENALRLARKYRHDWLNARGALVDSWRLIEFNADQLESQLDIVFSGDIRNKGDNPSNLRASTGELRAGLQFDTPLTRLSERNVYRQSLIEYQQARRAYYAFEDGVARALRQELRTILVNQINFELQRTAVIQAAEQIAVNDDIRADQEARRQTAGATAARDSVSALSDLLDAQNNFLSVFVNYEALRRQLDLDMGTMKLDQDGNWLDPGVIDNGHGECMYGDDDADLLPPLPAKLQRLLDENREPWDDKVAPTSTRTKSPGEPTPAAIEAESKPHAATGRKERPTKTAAFESSELQARPWWERLETAISEELTENGDESQANETAASPRGRVAATSTSSGDFFQDLLLGASRAETAETIVDSAVRPASAEEPIGPLPPSKPHAKVTTVEPTEEPELTSGKRTSTNPLRGARAPVSLRGTKVDVESR